MAESDVIQDERIAQIQAFFHLKSETDLSFLPGTPIPAIDGNLGDENSATNQAIDAWLEEQDLADTITPEDPEYIDKLYAAVRAGAVTDPAIIQRLEELSIQPDFLSEEEQLTLRAGAALQGIETQVLAPENPRVATIEAAHNTRLRSSNYSVDGMDDDEELTEGQHAVANQALNYLRRNGLSGNLDIYVDDEVDTVGEYRDVQWAIKNNENALKQKARDALADPGEMEAMQFYMWQSLLGMNDPANYGTALGPDALGPLGGGGAWSSPTLNFMAQFSDTDLPGAEPYVPPVPQGTIEYASYYMNNVVLTSGEYSIHARKVWEDMKQNPEVSPGQAIENYLDEYAGLWEEANEGRQFTDGQRAELRGQLIPQVQELREIEAAVLEVRPSPEMMADNFVENRVLPEMSEATREVFALAEEEGISLEAATEQYLEEAGNARALSGPGPRYTPNQIAEMEETLAREIPAVSGIHEAIKTYEGIEVTTEGATAILRAGWAQNPNLEQGVDHYTEMFSDKVDYYLSEDGGQLDQQTAVARAAVDVRAQIDRDTGVPERVIVDENHTHYQSQVMQMGDWIRDRMFFEEDGGVTAEMAEAYDMGDRDLSRASTLDFYTGMYGGGYRIYRRENLEEAMNEAYEDAVEAGQIPEVAPIETPETSAEETAEGPVAAIEQEQLALAEEILNDHGAALLENRDTIESTGMKFTDESGNLSPATLVSSARDPEAQTNFTALLDLAAGVGELEEGAVEQIKGILDQFNDLEGQRTDAQAQVAAEAVAAEVEEEAAPETEPETAADSDAVTAAADPEEETAAAEAEGPEVRTTFTEAHDAVGVVAEEPQLTETFAEDLGRLTEQTGYEVDTFIGNLDFGTPEEVDLIEDLMDKRQTMMDQYNAGELEASLETMHEIYGAVAGHMAEERLAFVEDNWDTISPWFEEIGLEVAEGDYERAFEILSDPDLMYQINQATTGWGGAPARTLLFENQDYTKIDHALTEAQEQLDAVETLARENGIDLGTEEALKADAAEPAAPGEDRRVPAGVAPGS